MLLTITTRYNQAASEPFLFATTPPNSFNACGLNPQLKNAIVLRDGHNGGCPANESKVPAAQDAAFAIVRVSNAGNRVNSESKSAGVKVHDATSTWNSRTEVIGNGSSSDLKKDSFPGHRKEKMPPLLPKTWISLGEARILMAMIGVNNLWIGVGGEGRHSPREVQCKQDTSKEVPRGRDMFESNRFASFGLARVIDNRRRRTRETILTGASRVEPSINPISRKTVSRFGLEAKNSMNVIKLNGFVYPMSFNSTRDGMPNNGG